MYLEIIILGILIGGFQNGRVQNITDMNIRGWYLILISLVMAMVTMFLNGNVMGMMQIYLLFFSMVIMLVIVALNLDKKGMWLILIGGLFNIGIMLFNGFQMPVMMETLQSAGLNTLYEGINVGSIVNYIPSDASGIMTIFTKFIAIPKPYPFPRILTIGDIFMSIGLFLFIVGEMKRPSYFGKGKMVSYSYGSTFKRR